MRTFSLALAQLPTPTFPKRSPRLTVALQHEAAQRVRGGAVQGPASIRQLSARLTSAPRCSWSSSTSSRSWDSERPRDRGPGDGLKLKEEELGGVGGKSLLRKQRADGWRDHSSGSMGN